MLLHIFVLQYSDVDHVVFRGLEGIEYVGDSFLDVLVQLKGHFFLYLVELADDVGFLPLLTGQFLHDLQQDQRVGDV